MNPCGVKLFRYQHRHEEGDPRFSPRYLHEIACREIAHTLSLHGMIEVEHFKDDWTRCTFTRWSLKAVRPGCTARVAEPGYVYLYRCEPLRRRWGALWVALRGLVRDTWREAWRFS